MGYTTLWGTTTSERGVRSAVGVRVRPWLLAIAVPAAQLPTVAMMQAAPAAIAATPSRASPTPAHCSPANSTLAERPFGAPQGL